MFFAAPLQRKTNEGAPQRYLPPEKVHVLCGIVFQGEALKSNLKIYKKMAKSRNNIVTAGLSGGVGNQLVFRQVNGVTIVAKYPNRKESSTPKQIAHHNKFAKATVYAKNALQNAALKKVYADQAAKRPGVSAYAMAVADYLKAPIIDHIDTSAYTGVSSGEKISIEVADASKVMTVKVKIVAANNSAVEEGSATLSEGKWVYTTTAINAALSGSKVLITATDRPGNVTTKEVTL